MSERFPNLFVVGAMRSGTTALHESLAAHPDIFMSKVKEPAYFADRHELAIDSRAATAAGFAGNRRRYVELFAAAGDVAYVGESSTHYTKLPRITGVAPRLATQASGPRILYIVRDPVERTLSHYRYAVRGKYERRSPMEALLAEPIYCAVSDYAMQIAPYVEALGADAVHIAIFEEVIDSDHPAHTQIFRWLGLDPPTSASQPMERRNEMAGELQRARGPSALHRLGRSATYQRVARAMIPGSVRNTVRRSLSQPLDAGSLRTPDVMALLRETHEPHAVAFEEVLGRPIKRWTTLRPSSA